MSIYDIRNLPHMNNDKVELRAIIKEDTVEIRLFDKNKKDIHGVLVTSLCVGEHLITSPDHQKYLRPMIGEALIACLTEAWKIGYNQARADIRQALGIGPFPRN